MWMRGGCVVVLTNEPEKKMPSTAAKAINRSPKVDRSSEIHFNAQLAFLAIQGTTKKLRLETATITSMHETH